MAESIFSKESAKRQKDQEQKLAANDLIENKATRVRVNFSLLAESNAKMEQKAKEMGMTKSALLQLWIHQNCDF